MLFLILAAIFNNTKWISPDWDNYFFYAIGVGKLNPDVVQKSYEKVATVVPNLELGEYAESDFAVKRTVVDNYPLFSYVVATLKNLNYPGPDGSEGKAVYTRIYIGFFFQMALVALIVISGFWLIRRRFLVTTALLAVLALVVVEHLLVKPVGDEFIALETSISGAFAHAFHFLLSPSPTFSPFGYNTRNAVALIGLLFFALRWSGYFGAGYLIIGVCCIIHPAYCGFVASVFLVIDLVARPAIFKRYWVLLAALFPVAIGFGNTLLSHLINAEQWPLYAGIALLFGLGLGGVAISRYGRHLFQSWYGFVAGLRRRQEGLADVVAMLVLATVIIIVSFVLTPATEALPAISSWLVLPQRSLAFFRIGFFLFAAMGVMSLLAARWPRLVSNPAFSVQNVLLLAAAGLILIFSTRFSGPGADIWSQFDKVQQQLEQFVSNPELNDRVFGKPTYLYLAIAKEVDRQDGFLDRYISVVTAQSERRADDNP